MKDRHGNEFVLVPKLATAAMMSAIHNTNGDYQDEYAAAIAAAPKFEAPEVDDAMCERVFREYIEHGMQNSFNDTVANGSNMIAAVRTELGPTLGLVELREPTAVECKLIAQMMIGLFNKLGTKQPIEPAETVARVIFPAVRAVILNKDKPQ